MASGEIAGALTVMTILESVAASADSGAPTSTRLLDAIGVANRTVWQQGQLPEHKGMGTTVVCSGMQLIFYRMRSLSSWSTRLLQPSAQSSSISQKNAAAKTT